MKEALELMGKIVTVSKVYFRTWTNSHKKKWGTIDLHKKRAGWFVGHRILVNGSVEYGCEDEPTIFYPEERIKCVLVIFWPNMKPVRVPIDAYEIGGVPIATQQKILNDYPEAMKEQSRIMKEEMKDWPRDEKGKWKKAGVKS